MWYTQKTEALVDSEESSAIDVTTVAHAVDAHDTKLVGNFVNHTVVFHANTPVVLSAGQFALAIRSRIVPSA